MRIYHLFPVGCPHLVPHIARSFASGHERMGTELVDHYFVISGASAEERRTVYGDLGVPPEQLVFLEPKRESFARLFASIERHAMLVLHGVFEGDIWAALALRPWLWRRTAWVMWGGDVHGLPRPFKRPTSPREFYRVVRSAIFMFVRRHVIRRLGAVAALAPGDFDVLQSHCGKLRNYRRAFYSDFAADQSHSAIVNRGGTVEVGICLGNSAWPSNGHLEALEWLSRFKEESIIVYCPLNYGDFNYREKVLEAGRRLLGEKFRPLLEFLDRDKYAELLRSLDILVFNHNRQQGLFALYTMLLAGKKCFIRSDVSVYAMLRHFGIHAVPTESLAWLPFADFSRPLVAELVEDNRRQFQTHLSSAAAADAWKELFASFRYALSGRLSMGC